MKAIQKIRDRLRYGLVRSSDANRFQSTLLVLGLIVTLLLPARSANAGGVDAYVLRYLDAKEPVSLPYDDRGNSRAFSAEQLSVGKRFFEENCKNCHVGGATLPDPTVPLTLDALKGAMPPRDNIKSLVAFLRQPMTYDGSEESLYCREVPASWLSDEQTEDLAAFLLRSAQRAPGWGDLSF
ncbi:photosystem II cytochrome PsbV2 [Leptolyngbya ohadii]|uniref:photosystem II cytochrome PsbV2 n=1 Tax=Leptolyngbya ohadii TaxID=1962290 RepID=UPI000B59C6D3|nr:photosystem II cytochrome PsbV2 [Leptolyngbya ohadii]